MYSFLKYGVYIKMCTYIFLVYGGLKSCRRISQAAAASASRFPTNPMCFHQSLACACHVCPDRDREATSPSVVLEGLTHGIPSRSHMTSALHLSYSTHHSPFHRLRKSYSVHDSQLVQSWRPNRTARPIYASSQPLFFLNMGRRAPEDPDTVLIFNWKYLSIVIRIYVHTQLRPAKNIRIFERNMWMRLGKY
jgi:hypothetical protein